ncbi:MAG: HAD-IIA family hydrolase [Thermoprotei archaeon]|nr:HAD-IIA family hydrolase [Thermoprotei archaeon]
MKPKLLIVDLDGVVWLGAKPIRENIEALARLQGEGFKTHFITNNSTSSRAHYARRLEALGIKTSPDNVTTSGRAASLWARENYGKLKVYVIGEEGLIEELIAEGHEIVSRGSEAEALIVGLDRRLCYDKLAEALKTLLKGAPFIATNTDNILPTEEGPMPGAGSIVEALKAASGRNPDFIAGKPNPWILEVALKGYNVNLKDTIVVGDRIDTDIEMAVKAGAKPVLVLTGIASTISQEEIKNLSSRKVLIVRNLTELYTELKKDGGEGLS